MPTPEKRLNDLTVSIDIVSECASIWQSAHGIVTSPDVGDEDVTSVSIAAASN